MVCGGTAWAQQTQGSTNAVSPYSSFGIGDLSDQALSRNYGMGSISISSIDRFNVNRVSPANLADIFYTSIDVSFNYKLNTLKTNSNGAFFRSGGLSGLSLAFPSRNNLVFGLSLAPVSAVGYDVLTSLRTVAGTSVNYASQTFADGGVNEVSLAAARRFWQRRVSVGLGLNYVFGSIDETITTTVGSGIAGFFTDTRLRGVTATLGFNYTDTLKTIAQTYRIGFFGKLPTTLRATETTVAFGAVSGADTSEIGGNVVVPAEIGFGIGYEFTGKYSFGLDVRYEDWSGFNFLKRAQTLDGQRVYDGRLRVNLGTEWIPQYNSTKFLKRISYRAGVRYENSYLTLRGQPINDYSFTVGMGIPINRNLSFINVAATIGQRGTRSENLIRENTYQFVIGLNFNELWFVKRRYD